MIDKNVKISFVIPCYYSEKTVGKVVDDICSEFPKDSYDIEIILVNDGSRDKTCNVIHEIANNYSFVTAINLAKNFGQDAACMAGYSVCKGDYIVTLDDDGQCPPSEAHILLGKIDEGYDAVFGRYAEKKQSRFKNFGSKVNDKMANVMINKPKNLCLNSYFVINRFVCDEMLKYDGPYPYIWGLILRCTDKIANADVINKSREIGNSTYTFGKLIGLWMNGFTAFSIKPLRLSTIVGVCVSFIGFIATVIIVIRSLLYGDVPGWTSLMSVLLLMTGIQMIMLGLLGEYIGRIYIHNNKAPTFVIHDVYHGEDR